MNGDNHQRLRDAFGQRLNTTTPHSDACLDCDASMQLVERESGVFVMTVLHDDSCPTFTAMRGAR